MCTCIYFVDIGSFDGKEMPEPPHDSGVDPDVHDEGMPDAKHDHQEADAYQRPAHTGARLTW